MKRLSEYLFLFTLGGCIYYSFEILFRGFSTLEYVFARRTLFSVLYLAGSFICLARASWKQVIYCTVFVTAMEFLTGILVNKLCGWAVWDYSDQPLQIFGQICVPFMIIFSGLCTCGIFLGAYLLYAVYREEKPMWHVL